MDKLIQILRNQALERAIGEPEAVLITFYGEESEDSLLYRTVKQAIIDIKDNR